MSKAGSDLSKAGAELSIMKVPLKKGLDFLIRNNTVVVFFVMLIIASLVSDAFSTERNIFNLLRQVAGLGIISMGMLLVVLTGGIDLSVGSIAALASVMSAYFLASMPLAHSIILAVIIGICMGAISGYLVAFRNMAPFVATLSIMTIARGLAFIMSEGSPIIAQDQGLHTFGSGYWLNVPYPAILMLIVFLIVLFILKFTVFGRIVTAIGSNESAVRLSGIRVGTYKFMVYCISGALCALAGIIITSRTGVGSPIVATGIELDAIAAVVIGGASLSGGRGTAANALLGVFTLGVIGNIMNLMNVPGYPQQVVKGLIIIAAVLLQGARKKDGN